MTNWELLKQDERYKRLSYEEQLQVNQHFVTRDLSGDERFHRLDNRQKMYVISQLAAKAPAYETPDPLAMEYQQLADRVKEGDEEAGEEAVKKLGWSNFRDQISIMTLLDKVSGTSPMVRKEDPRYSQIMNEQEQKTRDQQKAEQYLTYTISQDEGLAKQLRIATTAGTVGGFVADLAGWYALTAPIAAVGKGLVAGSKIGKATGMFAKQATGAGQLITTSGQKWFYQTLVPELAQNVRGGLIGLARENINGTIDERIKEDPEWYDVAAANAKLFGEYFLGDMLFFSALQIGKVGGKTLGKIYGKGYLEKLAKDAASPDEYGMILRTLMQHGSLDEKSLKALSPAQRKAYEQASLRVVRARNVQNLLNNPEELSTYFLNGKGVDIISEDGAFKVLDIPENKVLGTYKTQQKALDKAYKTVDGKIRPQMSNPEELASYLSLGQEFQLSQTIQANVKGLDVNVKGMAQMLKPDETGMIRKNNVRFVTKKLMNQSGLGDDVFSGIKVKQVDDYFQKAYKVTDDTLYVPKRITDGAQQAMFVDQFTKDLSELVQTKGGVTGKLADLGTDLIAAQRELGFSRYWVDHMAVNVAGGKLQRNGNMLDLIIDGTSVYKGDYKDMGNYLFTHYAFREGGENAFDFTKAYLWADKGVNLKQLKDGTLETSLPKPGGGVVKHKYQNLDDLLKNNPDYQPKLPQEMMPDIIITNNALTRFEIKSNVVSGNHEYVRDFLKDFKDYKSFSETVPMRLADGNITFFDKRIRKFQITDPETGISRKFGSIEDAKKFVKKGTDNLFDIQDKALYKMARITPFRGQYLVYSRDAATPFIAKNLEEVKDVLRKMPQPEEVGKELLSFDPFVGNQIAQGWRDHLPDGGFEANMTQVVDRMVKISEETGGFVKGGTALLDQIAPPDIIFKKMAMETGNEGIYKGVVNLEQARQLAAGGHAGFQRDYRKAIGKISRRQRRELGSVFVSGVSEQDWAKEFLRQHGREISPQELKVLTRTRDILGRSPEEGLYNLFGLDSYKFLTEYAPHLRATNILDAKNVPSDAHVAVKRFLGQKELPKEWDFFAKHMRTDELQHFLYQDDIVDIVNQYARRGYMATHVNPALDSLLEFAKDNKIQNLPPQARNRLMTYLEQVRGISTDEIQKGIEYGTHSLSKKIMHKLHDMKLISNPEDKMITDVVTLLNQFTIGSTMAYKAWLPLRNAFQPFFTLGPRFGNDELIKAMKKASKNGDEIVNRLVRQGRIPSMDPVSDMMVGSRRGFMSKFNEVGMRAYKNSDMWDRAIADQLADGLMSDASTRLLRGSIDESAFVKMAKLDRIDPLERKDILETLLQGGYEQAKDKFAEIMTRDAFFPYKAGTNPLMFHGTYGRLFGGFGHYPVYFTANIARGLSYGDTGQKIAFAARTVGNSLAIYNIFDKVLGIDAKAFLFTSPMSFSGGPYYDLMNTALKATDLNYYEGDIARAQLPGKVARLFTPGSSAALNFYEALQHLDNGNPHGFIVKAMSAPLSENF
jgi:hypothetical protein